MMQAIGKSLMGAGSRIAGPAATKSAAGRGLKTGSMNSKKTDMNLDKMVKSSNLALEFIKKIHKGVARFVGFMAKHSPALKQQLIVLSKGLSLMLRPIGDIMAKFMRPMAVWVMKVAQKWYSMFGTTTGETKDAKEDALKAAQDQLDALLLDPNADPQDIAAAEQKVAEAEGAMSGGGDEGGSMLSKLFGNMIPEAFKETLASLGKIFSELWNVIKEVGLILWDILGPGLERVAAIIGLVLLGALKVLTFLFEGIAFVVKMLVEGLKVVGIVIEATIYWIGELDKWLTKKLIQAFEWTVKAVGDLWDWMKKLGSWILEIYVGIWSSLWDAITSIYVWIKDKFIGIWDSLANAFSNVWGKVKDLISKLQFWKNKSDDDDDEKAVGGYIPTTGTYKLHAGERVLTAGDTARAGSQSSMVINNVFNIQATLNNDLDIQELANRLSELNETELRRRVSYF